MKKNIMGVVILLLVIGLGVFVLAQKQEIEIYEETKMNLTVTVIVKNIGSSPAINVPLRLAVPVNIEDYQKVENIKYSVEPEKKTTDVIGNEFIHYTIEQIDPYSNVNFTINMTLEMLSADYNIQKNEISNYEEDVEKFLLESSYINFREEEIQQVAKQISLNSSNIVDIAWNSYIWVIDNIAYQQVPGENDALTTLKNREGGSAEFGNLYVALLRANNIPARRISGWGKNFIVDEEYHLAKFSHGWAEFYLPEYGWIPVDPTWGRNHKFDYFAKTYDSHIVMTRGSDVHFLRRGLFTEPYGQTEVDTDYIVKVTSKEINNLSSKRTIIYNLIFAGPLAFIVFLLIQKRKRRKSLE